MATILTKVGYGQVEPNHLSAQRTGQIYAQQKWTYTTDLALENGSFLKYDGTTDGSGEFMLVFNEIKLYKKGLQEGYKDFAVMVSESLSGEVVPRLFKLNEGDIFTTNLIDPAGTTFANLAVGNLFVISTGSTATDAPANAAILVKDTSPTAEQTFEVLAKTTMPDGQNAVKVRYLGVLTV